MPKITMFGKKSYIPLLIAKSLFVCVVCIIALGLLSSLVILKLDLDLSYARYFSFIIVGITGVIASIIVNNSKGNIVLNSILAVFPVIVISIIMIIAKNYTNCIISSAICVISSLVTSIIKSLKAR